MTNEWGDYSNCFGEELENFRNWATTHFLEPLGASQVVLMGAKEPAANAGDKRDMGLISGSGSSSGGGKPTPVFLAEESHGQRSLAGYIAHRVTKGQT